jgi:hypothetical protein
MAAEYRRLIVAASRSDATRLFSTRDPWRVSGGSGEPIQHVGHIDLATLEHLK